MNRVVIIPTGNEVFEGIVIDTDGPMIADTLKDLDDKFVVDLKTAIEDKEDVIAKQIELESSKETCLIVLIGGSGGGHRHSKTLANDFTHSAMDKVLKNKYSTSIYGKNGHLWCRLVCGYSNDTLVINVPGPYNEAKAAIQAFVSIWSNRKCKLKDINKAMCDAVIKQYGNI